MRISVSSWATRDPDVERSVMAILRAALAWCYIGRADLVLQVTNRAIHPALGQSGPDLIESNGRGGGKLRTCDPLHQASLWLFGQNCP
jgi:hypothetical protein